MKRMRILLVTSRTRMKHSYSYDIPAMRAVGPVFAAQHLLHHHRVHPGHKGRTSVNELIVLCYIGNSNHSPNSLIR